MQYQNIKYNFDDIEDNRYDTRTDDELETDEEKYTVKNDKKFTVDSNIKHVFEDEFFSVDHIILACQDDKLERIKNNTEFIFIKENDEKENTNDYIKIKFGRP